MHYSLTIYFLYFITVTLEYLQMQHIKWFPRRHLSNRYGKPENLIKGKRHRNSYPIWSWRRKTPVGECEGSWRNQLSSNKLSINLRQTIDEEELPEIVADWYFGGCHVYPREEGSQFMEEFEAPLLYYMLLGKVKYVLKSITDGKTWEEPRLLSHISCC